MTETPPHDTLRQLEQTTLEQLTETNRTSSPPLAARRYDYTALSTANTCQRAYVLEHVLGIPHDLCDAPASEKAVGGEATERASDTRSTGAARSDPDVGQPLAIREGELFHAVVEHCWPMATDPAVWKDHAARLAAAHQWPDTLERVERLIDAFLRSPVSEWDIDQARVEVPFSISCEGRQVTGLIDALPTHPDGAPLVLDYKTGTTAPDQTQLLIYLLATHRDEGIPADAPAVEAAFLRVDKRDEFYLDRLDVSDLDATLGEAEERLTEWVQVAEMARYNAPEPGPHCECCGYQDVCDAAKEGQ